MASCSFSLSASYSELHDIRLGYHPEKFRVVFDLSQQTRYQVFTLDNPRRLVLDFSGTRKLPSVGMPVGLHDNIPVTQLRSGIRNSEDLRVVFDLSEQVSSQHFVLDNPPRLVVDIFLKHPAVVAQTSPIQLSDALAAELSQVLLNTTEGQATGSQARAVKTEYLIPEEPDPNPQKPLEQLPFIVDRRVAQLPLLEYRVKHFLLDDALPTYYKDGDWWLDLEAFINASEFMIERQHDGVWQGFFFNDTKRFKLDSLRRQVTLGSQPSADVAPATLKSIEGRLFVGLSALQDWFGLDLQADFREQSLVVSASEVFPVEQREQRSSSQLPKYQPLYIPVVLPDRYQWLSYPQLYMQGHVNHNDSPRASSSSGDFSMTGSMDLLKHQLFYTGSASDSSGASLAGSQRATFSRHRDRINGWLPAGLSRYELGDVYTVFNNLSSRGGSGQGISLVRQQQAGSVSQGNTDIVGDAPPGWDVELYHQGQLLGFSRVGADGRYRFEEQGTLPGKNEFTVRLYGPQGQYEVEDQLVWGGGLDLDRGEYSYRVDSVDYTQSLLNGEVDNIDALAAEQMRSAEFNYGLHRDLQLGFGYFDSSTAVRDSVAKFSDERYWLSSVRANVLSGVWLAEFNQQQGHGAAWQTSYLGNLGKHSYTLSYEALDEDFDSPQTVLDSRLDDRLDVSLFGQTAGLVFDAYSLRVSERNQRDGTRINEIDNRLSRRVGNSYLSHEMRYSGSSAGAGSYAGSVKASGRYQNYSLNAELAYDPKQAKPVTFARTKVRWQMNPKVFASLQLSKQFRDSRSSQISGDLTWRNEHIDVSLNAAANTEDEWSVGIGFSTSLGYNRHASRFYSRSSSLAHNGRLAFNVFVDDNQNNQLDEGEQLLSEVHYRGEQASDLSLNRYLSLVDLPSQNEYRLDTEKLLLEDPYLVANNRYYSVYTHAGSDLTFNLPVQHTGDIEGHILSYQADQPEGEHVEARPGTEIELYDGKNNLVAKATAEYDGYYSFNTVPVGHYRVVTRSTKKFFQQHERFFYLDKEDNYQAVEDMIHSR